MRRLKDVEEKLDALLEYLNVSLEKQNGWRVNKNKQEMGFHEKESGV